MLWHEHIYSFPIKDVCVGSMIIFAVALFIACNSGWQCCQTNEIKALKPAVQLPQSHNVASTSLEIFKENFKSSHD